MCQQTRGCRVEGGYLNVDRRCALLASIVVALILVHVQIPVSHSQSEVLHRKRG